MSREKMVLYCFRLPPKLLNEYRDFCSENCMDVSKRLRRYMEKDLEGWRKLRAAKLQKEKNRLHREKMMMEKREKEREEMDKRYGVDDNEDYRSEEE